MPGLCLRLPLIVKVLPDPVQPYANSVPVSPINQSMHSNHEVSIQSSSMNPIMKAFQASIQSSSINPIIKHQASIQSNHQASIQ